MDYVLFALVFILGTLSSYARLQEGRSRPHDKILSPVATVFQGHAERNVAQHAPIAAQQNVDEESAVESVLGFLRNLVGMGSTEHAPEVEHTRDYQQPYAAGHGVPPCYKTPASQQQQAACAYSREAIDLNDWDNAPAHGWIIVKDQGISRLTRSAPVTESKASYLVLKRVQCGPAEYSAKIRLDQDSIGGLVFRTQGEADPNKMVVEINTMTKSVALKKIQNGATELLDEHYNGELSPQFLHELRVEDRGADGLIQIFLDGKEFMSTNVSPFTGVKSFGVLVERGSGVFSNLSSKSI